MGCGASKAAEAADPLDPAAGRNKSSSVVSVNQKAITNSPKLAQPTQHVRGESNPFLEKQPGVDEHKRPTSARKKVERSEEKEEDEVEELTTPKHDSKKGAGEEEKEKESDDEEVEDKPAVSDEKDSHREKTSGRQLLAASTPVTPANNTTRTTTANATLPQPRKDAPGTTTTLARSATFTDAVLQQPPSYNLADPLTLTSGMSKCFLHYAHKKFDTSHSHSPTDASHGDDEDDEDKLDKKAVAQLAYDCVITFMLALKKEMVKVKEINRKKEEDYQRRRCLPGDTVDEVLDTCKEYLKSELVWKNGGITKTCFFFHFPRAFRAMFVYEKMTLEREQLVVKWNKVCADNRAKAEKEREKERKKDEAQMAGLESTVDGAPEKEKDKEKEKKKHKKKDKEGRKTDRRKARQTAPANSDLFANMANHGSSKPPQLAQAEAKLKSAQQANGKQGSTRNLLKNVDKDDDD